MKTEKQDIYSKVTNQIIEAIEKGLEKEKFSLPWFAVDNENPMPRNVVSRLGYKGINILLLWASAEKNNYQSGVWGTFNQWQNLGANIKKGEKATLIIYSAVKLKEIEGENGKVEKYFMTKGYYVFNIAQVENYNPSNDLITSEIETKEEVDQFFNTLNPTINYGGDLAFYSYKDDFVQLPKINHFKNTESYYAVLSHEMIHWTAHETRLNRDLKNRFGNSHYAMEELVAELGAAFLCSELGVSNNEPRKDHAYYIASWLIVLKKDKKAIFTASTKAQQAVEWMKERQQEIA